MADLSILVLSDTHIGYDLPLRPRRMRRLRGPDFLANMRLALQQAQWHGVDLVIHAGDLFFRTRIHPALIDIALMPLIAMAEAGTPVFLVPGNHESGRIPQGLWSRHPLVQIFSFPRTFFIATRIGNLALAGFPFARQIRAQFNGFLRATGWQTQPSDLKLLCMHQAVEGARAGVAGYIFGEGDEVIPGDAIPSGLACAISGHMHRAQVIRRNRAGLPLAAPVIYPGSVERTSFAERAEQKGCVILHFQSQGKGRIAGPEIEWIPLPTRPMRLLTIDGTGCTGALLQEKVVRVLRSMDPESIVRLRIQGAPPEALKSLNAASLRGLAPPTMNVELARPQADFAGK
jgi:exonuclease SbcD